MKKIVLIVFFFIPFISYSQSTTTFWSSDGSDLTGWSNDGQRDWVVTGGGRTGNCFKTETQFDDYENNRKYILSSPAIDLSNYDNPKLEVYFKLYLEGAWWGTYYDGAFIEVYNGADWVKLFNDDMNVEYDATIHSNNPFGAIKAWTNDRTSYTKLSVDLNDYTDVTDFQFRFSLAGDGSGSDYGMFLDDFSINGYAKTQIHNYGGTEQIVFDNAYLNVSEPIVRVSSAIAASFNRFKVEINTSPDFSEIAHLQEFSGSYTSGSEYNLTCNTLNPSITFSNNTTYYVRVAASDDNGSTWSRWSNVIAFTYKSSSTSLPQWHQTTEYQFEQNENDNIIVNSDGTIDNKSFIIKTLNIVDAGDDAISENNTWFGETFDDGNTEDFIGERSFWGTTSNYYLGLRYQNVAIPQNAAIEEARIFAKAFRPDPQWGTTAEIALQVYADDATSSSQFNNGNGPIDRSALDGLTVGWDVSSNEVWFHDYSYQSSDVKSLIQAIVNQAGWSEGNDLSLIIANDGGSNYRRIQMYDSDPGDAAQLYVKYQNEVGGTITSEPIYLASIDGASSWQKLYWSETGSNGDFRVTIQRWNGTQWIDDLSDLDYNSQGVDISSLGAESMIRLKGTFTYSNGTPTVHNWTVSCDDLSSNTSDLVLSYSLDETSPCVNTAVTYQLNVANNGPDEATNINIDVPLPFGLSISDTSLSSGTYKDNNWVIPAIQVGETESITLTAIVNSDQGGNTLDTINSITYLDQTDDDLSLNSVSWSITPAPNSAPTISTIENQQAAFNTPVPTIDFTVSDASATVSVSSSDEYLFPSGNMILGGDGTTNRTLDLTPGENQHGTATITVTAGNGSCTNSESFSVEVARHSFATWDTAEIVVGQADFTSNSSTVDQFTGVGSNSSDISVLGKLAVGSQTANRVLLFDQVPSVNGAPADYVVGEPNFTSSGGGLSSSLTENIDGVAFSPDGEKLIASDAGNNRVLIWNSIPTSDGEAADVVIGQPDFTSNSPNCSSTGLDYPRGLLVTPSGKLLISDMDNNRVLIYNQIPTSDGEAADLVIGQDNLDTKTSGTGANRLYGPRYLSLSPTGKLLIADGNNNRVLIYNGIPSQNGESADIVIGQEDFGLSSSGINNKKFSVPVGVTVSPTGILAIGDFANQRVLIFNEVPTTNGDSADFVLGQPDFTSSVDFNDGTGSSGSPSAMNMFEPYGINFDLNDRLYVNGRGMNRVMIFGDAPSTTSDLAIDAYVDNTTPCMGNPVTYTLQVVNNGPANATNVIMNSALPEGFNYVSHTVDRGTYSPQGGSWEIPIINHEDTLELNITGTVDNSMGGTSISIYGNVRSMNQAESDFSNNAVTKDLTVANNHTPTISSIADQKLAVNESTGDIAFIINDDDGHEMTVTATSSNQSLVPDVNISIGGSGDNRTIAISPIADTYGSAVITVNVTDGTCQTTQEFTVYSGNMWIGKTVDWHTVSNWTREVAKSGVDAYIPVSPTGGNYPVIANDATCNNIMIDEGASLSMNNNVSLTIEGDLVNDGSINLTNGTAYITSVTDITGSGTVQFHNLDISGTLNAGTSNVYVGGTWNKTGTFNAETSTIIFNGSEAQTIATSEDFYSLGANNSNGVTFNSAITADDTLKLTNGTFDNSNGLTLADGITIERTTGNLTAVPTFSGSANIVYKGSVTTGNEIPAVNQLNNLQLNGNAIEVTMNDNLTVTGNLDFHDGIITTGANMLIHSNTSASSLSGGSESSFVNGILRRYIASNTGTYTFPVGSGNTSADYCPVDFLNNNLTGINYLTTGVGSIAESGDNTDANLNITEGYSNNYLNVLSEGIWEIIPDASPTGGTYGVNLYFNDAMAAQLTDNHFGILKRPSGSTTYADWDSYYNSTSIPGGDNPGRTVSSGYAQRTGYTSFSEFGIGTTGGSLPITLYNFGGKMNKGCVQLDWTTLSESNNDYFIVERSIDGKIFNRINRVEGQGNTSQKTHYQVIDRDIKRSLYYYRLKQVDFDGTVDQLSTITVKTFAIGENHIKIYPQPAANTVHIKIHSNFENEIQVQLLNSLASEVIEEKTQLSEGINVHDLNLSQLKPGFYVLLVSDGINTYRKRLIIGR